MRDPRGVRGRAEARAGDWTPSQVGLCRFARSIWNHRYKATSAATGSTSAKWAHTVARESHPMVEGFDY